MMNPNNNINKRLIFRYLFFLILTTFLLFSPALQNDFVKWDDTAVLLNNPDIRQLDGNHIQRIFTNPVLKVYFPLTIFSFAVEHHFFGYQPFIYHLNNILLHVGVVVLIFWFALQLGLSPRAAMMGALIFGIHPIHVESVAWVTERKDVLYSFFYLLALCFYFRYLKTDKVWLFFLTWVFGLASILSKPMALSLPFILFLCDMYQRRTVTFKSIAEKLLVLLYIIPISWITYSLHARESVSAFGSKLLIWIWSFGFYVYKFFFPIELIYPYQPVVNPVHWLNPPYLAAIVFLLACTVFLIRFKKYRWWNFAVLYYFLSAFFLLRYDKGIDASFVADRFMYLPSLGFCLLLGCAVDYGFKFFKKSQKKIQMLYVIVICAVFLTTAFTTYKQVHIWKNSVVFWSYVIQKRPSVPNAYINRGLAFRQAGDYSKAMDDYNKALSINPTEEKAYNNRGILFALMGEIDLALADFEKALALNPDYQKARINRETVSNGKINHFSQD